MHRDFTYYGQRRYLKNVQSTHLILTVFGFKVTRAIVFNNILKLEAVGSKPPGSESLLPFDDKVRNTAALASVIVLIVSSSTVASWSAIVSSDRDVRWTWAAISLQCDMVVETRQSIVLEPTWVCRALA